jgi:hypothetical protein
VSAGMLGQLGVALQEMQNHGWSSETKLEVKIAGTLKNDKFIVIKPIKEKVVCNPNLELKQQHPYQGETK